MRMVSSIKMGHLAASGSVRGEGGSLPGGRWIAFSLAPHPRLLSQSKSRSRETRWRATFFACMRAARPSFGRRQKFGRLEHLDQPRFFDSLSVDSTFCSPRGRSSRLSSCRCSSTDPQDYSHAQAHQSHTRNTQSGIRYRGLCTPDAHIHTQHTQRSQRLPC
jgi:hypothetical protein